MKSKISNSIEILLQIILLLSVSKFCHASIEEDATIFVNKHGLVVVSVLLEMECKPPTTSFWTVALEEVSFFSIDESEKAYFSEEQYISPEWHYQQGSKWTGNTTSTFIVPLGVDVSPHLSNSTDAMAQGRSPTSLSSLTIIVSLWQKKPPNGKSLVTRRLAVLPRTSHPRQRVDPVARVLLNARTVDSLAVVLGEPTLGPTWTSISVLLLLAFIAPVCLFEKKRTQTPLQFIRPLPSDNIEHHTACREAGDEDDSFNSAASRLGDTVRSFSSANADTIDQPFDDEDSWTVESNNVGESSPSNFPEISAASVASSPDKESPNDNTAVDTKPLMDGNFSSNESGPSAKNRVCFQEVLHMEGSVTAPQQQPTTDSRMSGKISNLCDENEENRVETNLRVQVPQAATITEQEHVIPKVTQDEVPPKISDPLTRVSGQMNSDNRKEKCSYHGDHKVTSLCSGQSSENRGTEHSNDRLQALATGNEKTPGILHNRREGTGIFVIPKGTDARGGKEDIVQREELFFQIASPGMMSSKSGTLSREPSKNIFKTSDTLIKNTEDDVESECRGLSQGQQMLRSKAFAAPHKMHGIAGGVILVDEDTNKQYSASKALDTAMSPNVDREVCETDASGCLQQLETISKKSQMNSPLRVCKGTQMHSELVQSSNSGEEGGFDCPLPPDLPSGGKTTANQAQIQLFQSNNRTPFQVNSTEVSEKLFRSNSEADPVLKSATTNTKMPITNGHASKVVGTGDDENTTNGISLVQNIPQPNLRRLIADHLSGDGQHESPEEITGVLNAADGVKKTALTGIQVKAVSQTSNITCAVEQATEIATRPLMSPAESYVSTLPPASDYQSDDPGLQAPDEPGAQKVGHSISSQLTSWNLAKNCEKLSIQEMTTVDNDVSQSRQGSTEPRPNLIKRKRPHKSMTSDEESVEVVKIAVPSIQKKSRPFRNSSIVPDWVPSNSLQSATQRFMQDDPWDIIPKPSRISVNKNTVPKAIDPPRRSREF